MSVTDISDRYFRLAIENFERAERENSPQLQAKFREMAGEYRDLALQSLDRWWSEETRAKSQSR
jgi:hypothetical protein